MTPDYSAKDNYVLKLHELLWAFIERHDPSMTGNVVDCANEVLSEESCKKSCDDGA